MTLTLRPWQVEAAKALAVGFDDGASALIVQAATGTGKTVAYLNWIDGHLGPGQRALVMAHRKELIYQPIARMREFFPRLAESVGIVMGDHDDTDARVVVATVQTLNSNGRLLDVLAHGAFDLYVVDEAHHDALGVPTYRAVEERLREANPALLKTGWTATPTRTDHDGLITKGDKVGPYDRMAFCYPVQQAVRDGALCEFSAYMAGVPVSLSNIRETPSGWDDDALGDILNAENVWDVVLAAWRGELESAPDCSSHQTIVFTASVAQAHGGADFFQRHGVTAEAVDGGTPDDERAAILARFQGGETQMVLNCAVLTEGADFPSASCCLMVSPTKSPLVWTQKAGRTLRLDPNDENKHAVIVDFYPIERAGVFAADALGVPKHIIDAKEKAEEAGVLIGGWKVDRFGRSVTVDADRVVFRMLDLMARSRFPWSLSGHIATTALSAERAAAVVLPDAERLEKAEELKRNGDWSDGCEAVYQHLKQVRLYSVEKSGRDWVARLHGHYDEPDDAKAVVDGWPSDGQLGSRSARWRDKDATKRQFSLMRGLSIELPPRDPGNPSSKIKRGEASRLISEALTVAAVRAAEGYEERKRFNS